LKLIPILSGLVPFVFACTAPAAVPTPRPAGEASDGTATPVDAATPRRDPHLTEEQLELWNDPEFKRWFTLSYTAETEIEPSLTFNETEVVARFQDLMSAGRVDRAVELLEDERSDASSATIDFLLGNVHYERDEIEPAIAAYRVAVGKYPKFRRAWQILGSMLIIDGRYADSIEPLTQVIALGGGDARTYGFLGIAYSNVGKFLEAETAFRLAILMDADSVDWKRGLANSLFRQERFEEAVALTSSMIAENPDDPKLWELQAQAYIGLGEVQRAAENFEMVSGLGGATFASLAALGDIYVRDGLFDLAVDAYVQAFEKDPEGALQRPIQAARAMVGQAAYEEARRLLESLEHRVGDGLADEDRKEILRLRSLVASAEQAGAREAEILEEIISIDPLDGDALIRLGQYYRREGEIERAVFYFEQAAGISGHEATACVRHAQLLVDQSRYQEAIPLLRRALAIEDKASVRDYLDQIERIAQRR